MFKKTLYICKGFTRKNPRGEIMNGKDLNKKDYLVTTLSEFFGEYEVTTIDEYFRILDKETQKRSKMVAKSLASYLKSSQVQKKFDSLQILASH